VEVCPLSRQDNVVPTGLNLYPRHYSAAFAFSTFLYPKFHRLILRLAFPDGENYGLTVFRTTDDEWVRLSLSAGGVLVSMTEETSAPVPATLPFGSSLSASLACSLHNDVYAESSHVLAMPFDSCPLPP
jgi:hypothetical protein